MGIGDDIEGKLLAEEFDHPEHMVEQVLLNIYTIYFNANSSNFQ